MTPVFLMCARNKLEQVRQSAPRMLAQDTSWPIQVVFSDHWSTDGTYEYLRDLAASYPGPHEVDVMRCPLTDRTGVLGLNAHLDWVIRRLDEEAIVIFSSADDWQYENRVEEVMQVYIVHPEVEYVATRLRRITPNGAIYEQASGSSGPIDLKAAVMQQVGWQCGGAWKSALWRRVGPMRGIEAHDLILPVLAAAKGGLYYLDKMLHDSWQVADPEGVSLERAMQAAEGSDEYLPLAEANQYQFCSSHYSLMRRLREMKVELDNDTATALMHKLVGAANSWVQVRDRLTMGRVRPTMMRV